MSKRSQILFKRVWLGRSFIGLEITDQAVKLVELRLRRNGRFSISTYVVEPLPEGTVVDGKIVNSDQLLKTLSRIRQREQMKTKYVHFMLPSSLTMVRFLSLPDVRRKHLAKLIEFELKHHIHLPFDDPVYDFIKLKKANNDPNSDPPLPEQQAAEQPLSLAWQEAAASSEEESESGATNQGQDRQSLAQCDVALILASQTDVDAYVQILRSVGLETLSIEIKPLSIYRAVSELQPIDPMVTFMHVDLNKNVADLSIFHGGQLRATRNVAVQFDPQQEEEDDQPLPIFAEFEQAESVQREALHLQSASSELADEMERLMNFYRYTLNNRDHEFTAVLLSGDIEQLETVYQYLQERMTIDVIWFKSVKLLAYDKEFSKISHALAVPIGLALRGNQL